jgi:hypothetical protein
MYDYYTLRVWMCARCVALLRDAMCLYHGSDEPAGPSLKRWAKDHKQGAWEPGGGCGGVDVYNTDIQRWRPNQRVFHNGL